ncbi:MAG: hypothetical protein CBC91_02530 [Rickettsiales bacterium TMED131]|nr:MAG: hypothetical protein CBC91_02530 [Rickettsiales bacterium TMED131]
MSVNELRVCQFLDLLVQTKEGTERYRFQNYFVGSNNSDLGVTYKFAPFQVQGSVSNLNGDNDQIQVLFPAIEYALKLVAQGNGNRKSTLNLKTRFVTPEGNLSSTGPEENYIGLGATFNADTIELRFSSSLDAAFSGFPSRQLTEDNVGVLPLDSFISLR